MPRSVTSPGPSRGGGGELRWREPRSGAVGEQIHRQPFLTLRGSARTVGPDPGALEVQWTSDSQVKTMPPCTWRQSRAERTAARSASSRAAAMSTGSAVTAAAQTAARAVPARTSMPAHRWATAWKAPTGRPNCSRVRACCVAGSHTRVAVPNCSAAVSTTATGPAAAGRPGSGAAASAGPASASARPRPGRRAPRPPPPATPRGRRRRPRRRSRPSPPPVRSRPRGGWRSAGRAAVRAPPPRTPARLRQSEADPAVALRQPQREEPGPAERAPQRPVQPRRSAGTGRGPQAPRGRTGAPAAPVRPSA